MKRPFKVIKQDDKKRMAISFEGKADIYLIKTDVGFIIDVYKANSNDDHLHTVTVWDDDLGPSDEEIKSYLKEWGQSHSEICCNLDYDPKTSDELLMEDYFWMEDKRQWYPKISRMYSEREQEIATYLRENR